MSRPEHEQELDTSPALTRAYKLSGRIDQAVREHWKATEAEYGEGRFSEAINEQWTAIYAIATSGAHGWQIVEHEDGGGVRLAEGAYPGDVGFVVFENGWVHVENDRWFEDEDGSLRETIEYLKEQRDTEWDRADEQETEAFEADDRISVHQDPGGNDLPGWWEFDPTGYVGRPPAVVAHAKGYDLGQDEVSS